MDRAFVRNLKKFGTLFVRQGPGKMDVPFDPIEHSFFGFAIGAIGSVDLRVAKVDRNFLERPYFAASIHPHGHRSTCSQSGEQQIVGREARIGAAGRRRLIGTDTMAARVNFLRKSVRAAADNHTSCVTFFHYPDRVKYSCLNSSSRRRLLAALQECKQLRVDLVLDRGAHAVWRARNDFQRGALDQLRRKKRRVADGHDLIVVSMENECRHVELLEIFGEVRFGEGFDAIVSGLESA
jgi:hypothetical protein